MKVGKTICEDKDKGDGGIMCSGATYKGNTYAMIMIFLYIKKFLCLIARLSHGYRCILYI